MAKNSKIEWCDHTFNPWIGCTKVSPACDNCYAEGWDKRFTGGTRWGANKPRTRTSAENWKLPLRWNREAEKNGTRPRIFCASLADVFDNEVPEQWRDDLFNLIRITPHLDWLLLTKRIGNAEKMINEARSKTLQVMCCEIPIPNLWLGATICNQEEADRDIPKLLRTSAVKRFISIEPMLGAIDLSSVKHTASYGYFGDCLQWYHKPYDFDDKEYHGVDWVIVGGETGKNARPMHPNWVRSLRDQCKEAGVPFFFKQWGEWIPRSNCYHTFANGQSCSDIDPSCTKWPKVIRLTESGTDGRQIENADGGDDAFMQRVGKNTAGRLLDGILHDQYPVME